MRQIAADPSIREVILSGGDPLTIADDRLAELTLTKPLCLMAADYPEVRDRIFERYPYFRSSYFEGRKLFERSSVQSEPLAPVSLPPFPFERARVVPRS